MDNLIKVSICVAYYNRADRILESIGSLLSQQYDNYEVIVVNDGSSDSQVEKLLDSFEDHRLIVVHQQNAGFVRAMNKAISLARGEYIAIHGAGDISLPNRIQKQSEYLDSHSDIGLVSCLFDNVVMGGENDGKRNSRSKPTSVTLQHLLQFDNPFSQGEVMFRKSLFDKVGGYREYFRFAQDRDLWLRMIDHTGMHIIQEKLYERGIFVHDGVAADSQKTMLQKYLASLARACYAEKKRTGKDFVEKYGQHAAFFRLPDPLLAKYFGRQALEYMLKNEMQKSEAFAKAGINEKLTFYSSLAWIFVTIAKLPIARKILTKLVLLIYPNAAKKHRT